MQLFSADALGFSKKKKKKNFGPEKVKKGAPKVAHNRPRPLYFTVQPRPMANSPELILHIKKSRDQTSVLLSVMQHTMIHKYNMSCRFKHDFQKWVPKYLLMLIHSNFFCEKG